MLFCNRVFFLVSHRLFTPPPPFSSVTEQHLCLYILKGQQSSWDSEWCLMNNLLIFIRPAGWQAETSRLSSSLCCQQADDKQSSFCVVKRRLLTSRQARGIKPAMIKGPFSKSLAALHGRALWSRLKDWKWRWRNWRGEGGGGYFFIFLSATASEMRCAWGSLHLERGWIHLNSPCLPKTLAHISELISSIHFRHDGKTRAVHRIKLY